MFLDKIDPYKNSTAVFFSQFRQDRYENYLYRDLTRDVNRLAQALVKRIGERKVVIPVYGHKDPRMLASFFAIAKAGYAYCPIDSSTPAERVQVIIDKLDPPMIFAIEPWPIDGEDERVIHASEWADFGAEEAPETFVPRLHPDDVMYILFTSGSTGVPKGVPIRYRNLDQFQEWFKTVPNLPKGSVIMNQAPYSFDVSLMDIVLALNCEGRIFSISREEQSQYKLLIPHLKQSELNIWISTPSFADLCMVEPQFNAELLPQLHSFIFAGEILTPKTCRRLKERFPEAKIINAYGPTEATVVVTAVEIDEAILSRFDLLPIGRVKPGSRLAYEKDGAWANEGELVIMGDTVGPGYFQNPEQTAAVFKTVEYEGTSWPAYWTGDLGYVKDDLYFCVGRKDSQIKLHGYRIELGDIESHLLKLDEVSEAAVIPDYVDNKAERLTAYIVLAPGVAKGLKTTIALKNKLSCALAAYMVPQRFVYLDCFPRNINGKIDRKALGAM